MDAPALLILCRTSVTIPVCSDWAFDIREGEQCWSSGESASLPPMCPGFDSRTTWRHVLVEFVVGSLLWSKRFFSERVLRFYPLLKNQHFPNSKARAFLNEWLSIPWYSVGKQITYASILHQRRRRQRNKQKKPSEQRKTARKTCIKNNTQRVTHHSKRSRGL